MLRCNAEIIELAQFLAISIIYCNKVNHELVDGLNKLLYEECVKLEFCFKNNDAVLQFCNIASLFLERKSNLTHSSYSNDFNYFL